MNKVLQEKLNVCLYWFQFLNECTITKDYGVIIPSKFHEDNVNKIKNTITEYQNDIYINMFVFLIVKNLSIME